MAVARISATATRYCGSMRRARIRRSACALTRAFDEAALYRSSLGPRCSSTPRRAAARGCASLPALQVCELPIEAGRAIRARIASRKLGDDDAAARHNLGPCSGGDPVAPPDRVAAVPRFAWRQNWSPLGRRVDFREPIRLGDLVVLKAR